MKKLILFFAVLFSMFGTIKIVNAEEVEQEQIVEVVEQEEETKQETTLQEVLDKEDASFQTQFNAFANKWLTPILSACGGIGGCVITILVAFAKIKMAQKEAKDMQDEATKKINEAKEEIKNAKAQVESMIPAIEEAIRQSNSISMFKELIALLLASNPDFANNPYIPRIMELLNEGSVKNANEKED